MLKKEILKLWWTPHNKALQHPSHQPCFYLSSPGVPETPDLANTFYEQYNDFENDEEDSDNADVVVGTQPHDDENTLVKDDQEALMDYLAMALEKSLGGE